MARLLSVAVLASALLCAAPARADFVLGLGVTGDFGIANQRVEFPNSWSVGGRLGYRLAFSALELTPELDVDYSGSTASPSPGRVDWAFQVVGGGRIGVTLGRFVPSLYFHAGLGSVQVTSSNGVGFNRLGPYYEGGFGLDVRPSDRVSFGLQAGYGAVSVEDLGADVANASIYRFRAGLRLTFLL